MLLDVVNVQLLPQKFQQVVGLHLIRHHEGPQLIFVHYLHFLVYIQSLTFYRLQLLLFVAGAASSRTGFYVVFIKELLIGYVLVQPQGSHVLVDGLKGEEIRGAEIDLHC